MDGNPVTSAMGTKELWKIYPVSVRRWINRHGGLSGEMIYMEGRSLNGIVTTCDRPTQRALLLQQSAGYSGTLAPGILPQFVSPPSVHFPVGPAPIPAATTNAPATAARAGPGISLGYQLWYRNLKQYFYNNINAYWRKG